MGWRALAHRESIGEGEYYDPRGRRDVTPGTLNTELEFDAPFRICARGAAIADRRDLYAPECYLDLDAPDELNLAGGEEEWEPVSGWSGQEASAGSAVMHPSEFLGGALSEWVLTQVGETFVIVVVEVLSDEPAGWALLRHKTRQLISSEHNSIEGQVRDALSVMHPHTDAAVRVKAGFEYGETVDEFLGSDPEAVDWLCAAIESESNFFWEEGELFAGCML